MLPRFQGEHQQRQRDELYMRKQLLREINGQEIDRIKGVDAKGPPRDEWLRIQNIDPDDDDATKSEKYYHNSLVISKKPYFFRHLYPELDQLYRKYEKSYDDQTQMRFGVKKIKKLMMKPNKTEEERKFIKKYEKYAPLITTPCLMNRLCKSIEDTDFDIKFHHNSTNILLTIPTEKPSQDRIDAVASLLKYFKQTSNEVRTAIYQAKQSLYEDGISVDTEEEMLSKFRMDIIDEVMDGLHKELDALNMSNRELFACIKEIASHNRSFDWDFVWRFFGSSLVDLIPDGNSFAPVETTPNDPEAQEYLGKYYKLVSVPRVRPPHIIIWDGMIIDEDTGNVLDFLDDDDDDTDNDTTDTTPSQTTQEEDAQ